MCSDPQTTKKDGQEYTFACRNCNDCIATRRAHWVARAMMEKATSGNALAFALTYNDDTPHNRASARVFCYADVRSFFHRLRAAVREVDPSDRVRFLCAGEQGSRNKRCHWHVIIYSKTDLLKIGVFKRVVDGVLQPETNPDLLLSSSSKTGKKVRLDWSTWGHGMITVQVPDEAGMAYCLSYALKDQFTIEKSERTMRVIKSEDFATGLFRMSKRPAIGEQWLFDKLSKLDADNSVLPSLSFTVPNLSGFYHPSGRFRRLILDALEAIVWRVRVQHGTKPAQLGALLASLVDQPEEQELFNVTQKTDEFDDLTEAAFAARSRQNADAQSRAEYARRCGGVLPCRECLGGFDQDQLDALKIARRSSYNPQTDSWAVYYQSLTAENFSDRAKARGDGCNSQCALRGARSHRHLFPKTGGWS